MSAYICDNKTISAIAKAFVEWGIRYENEDFVMPSLGSVIFNADDMKQAIGQDLLKQNYASVNFRYNEDTETPEFEYEDVDIDEGIVHGCIDNFNYQACETDNYAGTGMYRSLMILKGEITKRLLRKCGMTAQWGYGGHNMLE